MAPVCAGLKFGLAVSPQRRSWSVRLNLQVETAAMNPMRRRVGAGLGALGRSRLCGEATRVMESPSRIEIKSSGKRLMADVAVPGALFVEVSEPFAECAGVAGPSRRAKMREGIVARRSRADRGPPLPWRRVGGQRRGNAVGRCCSLWMISDHRACSCAGLSTRRPSRLRSSHAVRAKVFQSRMFGAGQADRPSARRRRWNSAWMARAARSLEATTSPPSRNHASSLAPD